MRRLMRCLLLAALTGCATQQVGEPPIGDDDASAGETGVTDDVVQGNDVQIGPKDDVVNPVDDTGFPSPDVVTSIDVVTPPFDMPVVDPDTGVVARDAPFVLRDVMIGADLVIARDTGTPTDTGMTPACRATTCGACTPMGSCGWCGATSMCLPGTATGPLAGTCASGWAWTTPMCPADPCAVHNSSCNDCTPTGGCGWCRNTHRCVSGTATGPTDTTACGASNWAWTTNDCTTPGDGCASSSGCASCARRSNCGWCDDSDTCHTGTSSGPTSGACTSGHWNWSTFLGLFCP